MKALLKIALAIALVNFVPALAQAPKPEVASPALQKEFDAFIGRFRVALKANDASAIAGMTKFPFGGNAADAAQFRTKIYPKIFNAKYRACIQHGKGVYDRDGLNNDNFFIFCGDDIYIFTKTPEGFLFTEVGVND
jgi:hypothetical protein